MVDNTLGQLTLEFENSDDEQISTNVVGNRPEPEISPLAASAEARSSGPVPFGEHAPMLRHYLAVKEQYPEHLLLFQVGDFYEIFFDDSKIASDCLGIRLTSRNKDDENAVPMCGVPIHALDTYLPKLLSHGLSCVIMSQVDDGSTKKGGVRREVSRIVTPGVRYLGDGLDDAHFNYLAAVAVNGRGSGAVCYTDVSTGRLRIQEAESVDQISEILDRVRPVECILPSTIFGVAVERRSGWFSFVRKKSDEFQAHVVLRPFEQTTRKSVEEELCKRMGTDIAVTEKIALLSAEALTAMATVFRYVDDVSCGASPRVSDFQHDEVQSSVVLDSATRRNLELTETSIDRERRGSLLGHIDYTRTAMGARLLSDWILAPSTKREEIERRHESVAELCEHRERLQHIRHRFLSIRDLDRLISRIAAGRAVPRDLGMLSDSLQSFPELEQLLSQSNAELLGDLHQRFDMLTDVAEKLGRALVSEPPTKISDGGIFREGYHDELDRLRSLATNAKELLAQLEGAERVRTGISVLKVRYNNVFGYFIEVSKTHLSKVPSDYERKQTLVNAERFVTPQLKKLEVEILSARGRQIELEKELFIELRDWIGERLDRMTRSSHVLSVLDAISSLAHLAIEHNFVRPVFQNEPCMDVSAGRHPVVERVLGEHNFIPNDIRLDGETRRFALLTGPNMGGKSTYLRQVAIIQILAQSGSFVPARRAQLGVVDRIFTRIGASDDLSRGDSTFMVEMRETANIIRKATRRSLVLIDEIGRGTATADGLAIASAVAEWLHDRIGCITVFATHFHELISQIDRKEGVFGLVVGVVEQDGDISFTHRIEEGAADRSYGIEVARLAGLPEELLVRSQEVLAGEVQRDLVVVPKLTVERTQPTSLELSPEVQQSRKLIQRLENCNPENLTPLQAIQELMELKGLLEKR